MNISGGEGYIAESLTKLIENEEFIIGRYHARNDVETKKGR